MRKIPSPHDNTPSIDRQLGLCVNIRPYATAWHGENGDALLLLLTYFTTPRPVCQYLFSLFFVFLFFRRLFCRFFKAEYRKILFFIFPECRAVTLQRHFLTFEAKSHKKIVFLVSFFYSVSFLTNFLTKNRIKWIFTNPVFCGIILKLSAAPTPQRHAQLTTELAEYQAYDINLAGKIRLCCFICYAILLSLF